MDYQDYARLKGLFRLFGLIPRFRGQTIRWMMEKSVYWLRADLLQHYPLQFHRRKQARKTVAENVPRFSFIGIRALQKEKAAPKRLLNSNPMMLDQAAINAGLTSDDNPFPS